MSSFGENFERDENKNFQFDQNAFYPVLASVIILLILFYLYKIYSFIYKPIIKYQEQKSYRNCQCKVCKQRLQNIINKKKGNKRLLFFICIVSFLFLGFSICYKKTIQTQKAIKQFNPYEILEITEPASVLEIKKAYKKLALLYHPDKNPNNIQAKAKFILISKAYETLTNEEAKKNYEQFGNPEGRNSMRLSIGLPSFILDKKNHYRILLIFLVIVCIIIPIYFFSWYVKTQIFDEAGLFNMTKEYFKRCTNLNSQMKNIPFYLGTSREFIRLPDKNVELTTGEIEDLFSNYKEYFPGDSKIEEFISKLSLKNKKAISIAYAYSFGDRQNKNYLKLLNVNDYIILLAKLLDSFYEAQKEKYFSLLLIKQHNIQELGFKNLNILPIKREFLEEILSFQQCFYQGIPIPEIRKNISYVQLPYITTKNLDLIQQSHYNIKFKEFLCKKDEQKKLILKTIFNFNEEEINDIILASHSIPQYEIKCKKFVDGFENTDFVQGDTVTYKITLTRKNIGHLSLGVGHSNHFPGLFNECIYFTVLNIDNIIWQEKILINKKITEFEYKIDINQVGNIPIKIIIVPSSFYEQYNVIVSEIDSISKSEKREELLKKIDKRKEKIPLSYFQEIMKEAGRFEDSDEEEETETEEIKPKEEEIKSLNKELKHDTLDKTGENRKIIIEKERE